MGIVVIVPFLQCIKDQASSNEQKIESQECFQFLNQNNTIPKLSVKINSNTPGPKWTLAFEGSRQVAVKIGKYYRTDWKSSLA